MRREVVKRRKSGGGGGGGGKRWWGGRTGMVGGKSWCDLKSQVCQLAYLAILVFSIHTIQ